MNFGEAVSYITRDTDWLKKIGLIALVGLIPIIGQLVLLGWTVEIVRRVIHRNPNPLPELDFANQLALGFKVFVASLVYSLPLIVLNLLIQVPTIYMNDYSNNPEMANVFSIVVICLSCVVVIFSLLLALVLPAVYAQVAVEDSIGAGLNFGKVLGLVRSAPGAYLLLVVASIAAGLVASLGVIACVIGVIFTSAFVSAVMAHLYGQAYLEAKKAV